MSRTVDLELTISLIAAADDKGVVNNILTVGSSSIAAAPGAEAHAVEKETETPLENGASEKVEETAKEPGVQSTTTTEAVKDEVPEKTDDSVVVEKDLHVESEPATQEVKPKLVSEPSKPSDIHEDAETQPASNAAAEPKTNGTHSSEQISGSQPDDAVTEKVEPVEEKAADLTTTKDVKANKPEEIPSTSLEAEKPETKEVEKAEDQKLQDLEIVPATVEEKTEGITDKQNREDVKREQDWEAKVFIESSLQRLDEVPLKQQEMNSIQEGSSRMGQKPLKKEQVDRNMERWEVVRGIVRGVV